MSSGEFVSKCTADSLALAAQLLRDGRNKGDYKDPFFGSVPWGKRQALERYFMEEFMARMILKVLNGKFIASQK